MPNFYLLRPDGSYSDLANYPEQPAPREDGEWVEGIPYGLISFRPLALADQLDAVFSQQPVDLQAQFSPLRAAIKLELDQGRLDIAKRVIELAPVPPELEAQKEALLALFREG
jgi:hypothetical protein